ncbi:bone morphogenetic protein 1-like [Hyposmocoma kahamanoa]|uniref:bone morphogenetic protein 1-like n=1 Tax=Hyposmocoma kahamanoa TaxID=1477025 RepID=UPI000E6D6F7D|nr:bone morphogenetic protein 1-like [Hyposmocoma kahamanoa]
MRTCSRGKWLLQACVITAMISVGNTFDLCEKYNTFGFKSKKQCVHTGSTLSESWQNAVKTSKDVLGIVSHKVSSKLAILFANMHLNNKMGIQQRTLRNGPNTGAAQFLPENGLSSKKKVTLKEVNQERGFDITKEEMTKFKMWDKGVIPYFIDEHSFDKVLRDRIRTNLDEVNAATSLQFMEIPRPPDDDNMRYVFFINRRGALKCVDYTPKDFSNQGVQRVILGYDCIDLNTGMAAIILTLVGVPPQHNAPDRNKHIEIVEENIIPEKVPLFTKLKDEDWLFHDVAYDFESASHYHYHKYSVTGRSSIQPRMLEIEAARVGQDKTFSYSDLLKINMLYNYLTRGPNGKKIADCSQMFRPGRDFYKYKQLKNNLKPRKKPAEYTKQKISKEITTGNVKGQHSGSGSEHETFDNEESVNDSLDNYSGADVENKNTEKPVKLSGHRPQVSAETQKRLKLKQIIQNESDFHTEERK